MDRAGEALRLALQYAGLGWPVFPIKPNEKTPAITGWQKDATRDPRQLEKWFGNGSAFNIGILTGVPSGFFVLDVDPRNGGDASLDELQTRIGKLPDTVIQQTAGGGWHYLFRTHPDRDIRNGTLPGYRGLDIKGTGGYIVVPPSWVADRRYVWEESSRPGEVAIAEVPEPLLRVILQRPSPTFSEIAEAIPEGRRNSTLTSHAGKLRSMGWGFEEIRNALLVLNQNRCKPPIPESEVEGIARSISRYDPGVLILRGNERSKSKDLNRTDYGNAERLVAYHGTDLRYCPQLKTWLVWNEAFWDRDPGHLVMQRALDTVRRIYGESGQCDVEEDRGKHAKHAMGSERAEGAAGLCVRLLEGGST